MRWPSKLLLCFAVVCIIGLTNPTPASADVAGTITNALTGGACSPEAPDPHTPVSGGAAGTFTRVPNPIPPEQDPFAAGANTTIFQQYGTAGLWWPTYDLGCGGTLRDPGAVVWTDTANSWFDAATIPLVGTDQLDSYAQNLPGMSFIDAAVRGTTWTLKTFFVSAMSVGFALLALWIISKARGGVLSEISNSVFWAGAVLLIGTFAVNYPVTAGHWFDNVTTGTSQAVSGAFGQNKGPGDDLVSQVNDEALYNLWLRGMFGSDNSATAKTFGPQFYKSMALSWSEAATVQTNPAAGQKIIDAKKASFTQLASQLHNQDPTAYGHMQGKDGGPYRLTLAALIAGPLSFTLCLFPALAAVMVVLARLIGRLFIMAAPVVVPFGILHKWSSPVQRLWSIVQSTFVNLVVFSIAGGAMAAVTSGLLSSGLPIAFVMLLVGLATIGVLMATHPGKSMMRQLGRATSFATKAILADSILEHTVHGAANDAPQNYADSAGSAGSAGRAGAPSAAYAAYRSTSGRPAELQQALPTVGEAESWNIVDPGAASDGRQLAPYRPLAPTGGAAPRIIDIRPLNEPIYLPSSSRDKDDPARVTLQSAEET